MQLQCFFILFHAAAAAYAVLFLHPYYGSNDEFSLAAIASGAYGDYTHYFIYLHSGFGWILKVFYMCMPGVNWYTIVMYGLIFLSLTTVGCTWIRCSEKTGTVLSVMLVLACVCPLYVEMQYTKTAAVVTAAGYFPFKKKNKKKKKKGGGGGAGKGFILFCSVKTGASGRYWEEFFFCCWEAGFVFRLLVWSV